MTKTGKTRRSKNKTAELQSERIEMCSVRVGNFLYGVPITSILEILGATKTRAVPLSPSYIGGLVHYRGDVLTTVSLRKLLDMPAIQRDPDIMVFEGAGGNFGLLVDAVGEVMTVSTSDYEANPSILNGTRSAIISGAYKLKDGLLVVLDTVKLDPMKLAASA